MNGKFKFGSGGGSCGTSPLLSGFALVAAKREEDANASAAPFDDAIVIVATNRTETRRNIKFRSAMKLAGALRRKAKLLFTVQAKWGLLCLVLPSSRRWYRASRKECRVSSFIDVRATVPYLYCFAVWHKLTLARA